MSQELIHGTAVAINGNGILLVGPSGSGKSDLALRLIDRGSVLVSDDIVILSNVGNCLSVGAAPNIEGKIEVRGVGICTVPHVPSASLRLVIALSDKVERLPDENRTIKLLGVDVPQLDLAPFEISTALKVEIALRDVVDATVDAVSQGQQE
ncbi:MAG: HPr kinase/phosphatase C-terminal domain-containing protein [Sphingomonadaceae bacterium]|nr:HPr kinase/phosphatase C-terminal domain-containing protein [Sphingomonadaceae bacterium]